MSSTPKQHPQEPMLTSLFNTMRDHNIEYCVLHSTDSLPYSIESDLDIAVSNTNIQTIEKVLSEAATSINWFICQKLWYDVPHCVYYVVCSRDDYTCAAIDFMIDKQGIGRYGFPTSDLLSNKIHNNNFYQTNPAVEFCYKIVKRIRKGSLKSGDSSTLFNLLKNSNIDFVNDLLRKQLGHYYARKIIRLFSSPDGSINTGTLRTELLLSNIFHRRILHPILLMKRVIMQCIRITHRIYNPTGLIITTPKSHLISNEEINAITNALSPAFRRIKKNVTSYRETLKSLSSATLVLNTDDIDHILIKNNFFKKPLRVNINPSNGSDLHKRIIETSLTSLKQKIR